MTTPLQTTNGSNRFIRDIMWVALYQSFTMLLSIITLPVLTKTYTSEIYGIWTQINVTVGLLVAIVTLQFVTAVVRFLAGEEDKSKRLHSLGTMLYTILIFASLTLIVSNIWASQISLFIFGDSSYGIFVRLAFLWACADTLYAFFISYFRARGKIKRLSVIQAFLSASKMGLIVAIVLSGLALQWVVASMIFVDLLFIFYVLFIIVREDGFPVPNFKRLREFLAFSIPQIPVSILAWIMSASDRYFITHFLNLSETGIYASSNSLAGLISLFYFPIGYVLFPVVSKAWEQNRKGETKIYFEYSARLFLTLAIPAAIGLSLVSQPLLKILATSEYLAGIKLVLLIAISQVFAGVYQINEYIVFLVKQTKWLPIIIVISAGISIGINVILIPYIGITGAAISKVVAYLVLAVIVTVWIKRAIGYNYYFGYIGKIVVASLLMAVCLYFLKIGGIAGIVVSVIIGSAIFISAMLLMKAFTEQDKRLFKQVFKGIMPWA
jgi:O-antigen/teichoic acid export membrane protein